MSEQKKEKNWKVSLASLLLGAALVLTGWATNLVGTKSSDKLGVTTNLSDEPMVLVGTVVGTTTTGVSFYSRQASTTYPFRLAKLASDVTFNIQTFGTSTGPNGFATFSILSSNTAQCDTASTTYSTPNNNVIVSDIKWSDAGNHLKNAAAVTSLSTGTTTIGFTHNSSQLGKELILTNVTSKCLALEVAASSTVLAVTVTAK